jgi:small subunit ribosomal protein S17
MPKRVAEGIVTSDKMTKTRRVEIPRLIRHPLYGKYVRRKTVCIVHDEQDESHTGDRVEIVECRPISKKKRWNLIRVVEKSRLVDVAALRAKTGKAAAAVEVSAAPERKDAERKDTVEETASSEKADADNEGGTGDEPKAEQE